MVRNFNELFRLERYYGNRKLSVKQIKDARIGEESMAVLTSIANRLDMLVFSILGSLIGSCKMAGIAIKQYLVKVIK